MPDALFKQTARRREVLKSTTIREFSGGWNVIDQDLNLSSQFAKRLVNMERKPDGSIGVRAGTKLFFDTSSVETSDVINAFYFNDHIVCIHESGVLTAVDGTGMVRVLFDENFATALPGSPQPWHSTSFVSAAVFRNELILCNGTDKPLKVQASPLFVDYLQDLATLSNVNTPVARYVTAHKRFLCMYGDPTDLGIVHISSQDTSGTWAGDPAPNNATTIRVDTSVPAGSSEIRGGIAFGDRLVIAFDDALVPIQLGTFNDAGDHTPSIEDPVDQYGAISHRTIISLGDDALFCDVSGIPSLRRAVLTSTLRPERVSQLIDPEIQQDLQGLPLISLEDDVFSVYNRLDGQYMLFIPNSPVFSQRYETRGFVYASIPALKVQAWNEIRGWNWQWGCRTQQGRVFFGFGTQGFLYTCTCGLQDPNLNADFIGDQETWSDGTAFSDHTGWTPVSDVADSGIPIDFEWELPWADFDKRANIKHTKYLGIDAVGDATFTVDMFGDYVFEDRTSPGEPFLDGLFFSDGTGFELPYLERELSPMLSTTFVAGDVGGFGVSQFGSAPFGSARDTSNPHLMAWPAKAKISKLRIHGATRRKLNIIAFTFYYVPGSIRRK